MIYMATFHISAFADEGGKTLTEQIAALKAHGFTHIEPRGLDEGNISVYTPEQARAVKAVLDEYGIGVSSIGSHYGKIEITDDFEPHFEAFKNCVEVANILGTKRIRMFSFYFNKGESYEEYRDEVFARIERMCDYSLANGILCCHENEKGIYGDIDTRCLDLLKTFKGKLGGIFDPSNFIQCGVKILPAYDMLKEYIDYFHIKDCLYDGGRVVPAGCGDGDIVELLKRFDADNTGDHFLTLEPHLKVFDGLAALETEGGQADKLKDDYSYPTNRAAFDAAADALDSCLTAAGIMTKTTKIF